MADEARPTDDIDIVVELLTYANEVAFEEQLRKIGFENDMKSKVRCRFKFQGIIIDIMSTHDNWSGFNNKWYPDGYKNAMDYTINKDYTIKIFSPPYFIASKLEAFKDRGKNDGRQSNDFEDIIFVFEYREAVWEELKNVSGKVQKYLKSELNQLLNNPFFEEWINSHVDQWGSPPATYYIIEQLKEFVSYPVNQKN